MIEVVGGPWNGQRVREVLVVDGTWVMDRAWLCRPVERRGRPRESWPYRLRDGRYVWDEVRKDDEGESS